MSKVALGIKKNDTVQVISGRDASTSGRVRRGRVLEVLPDKGRVVVEGVNIIKRHTKANPQKNIKGGIVEREASLHLSNVQLVCPECGAPTRVGRRVLDDGTRVRFCVKCKGVVDK
ncbi:MAG: 50S ribosomal protein L24 [Vicinamibacterales bacterium]